MKFIITLIALFFAFNLYSQRNKQQELKFFPHKKDGKWGYVKKNGKVVINYQFEEAYRFSEGLAVVKKDMKYGFINQKGELAISNSYEYASRFQNGYSLVQKDDKRALIRKDGSVFLNKWFEQIEQFWNGVARAVLINEGLDTLLKEPYLITYFKTNGEKVADCYFSGGGAFTSNSRAKVNISGEYFFLDTLGNLQPRKCEECEESTPFTIGKKTKPEVLGGEIALQKFISANIIYPKKAILKNIEGQVLVKAAINPKGKIVNIELVKSVHPLLDNAAIEVVKKLPRWKPGTRDGVPICFFYIIPVNFRLN